MEQSSAVEERMPSGGNSTLLLARLRKLARKKTGLKLSALSSCKAVVDGSHPSQEIRAFFDKLSRDDKHYWVATYYALLMPKKSGVNLLRISPHRNSPSTPLISSVSWGFNQEYQRYSIRRRAELRSSCH